MKKGFTLIELLAVIIIISLLVIISLPKINNSVRNNSTKTDGLVLNMIEQAASFYIDDNKNFYYKENGMNYCISIKKMVEKGYLEKSINYNGESIINSKSIQVRYNDGFTYELVDNESCIEDRYCRPVTEETKTTGKVPTGDFLVSEEYKCDVNPYTTYTFFVVSTGAQDKLEHDNVNLILERSINSDGSLATNAVTKEDSTTGIYSEVQWCSKDDFVEAGGEESSYSNSGNYTRGPITILKFLNEATKDWTNLENLNETYDDENVNITTGKYGKCAYGSIQFSDDKIKLMDVDGNTTIEINGSSKARLPRYSEVHGEGLCLTENESTAQLGKKYGSCPLWLVNYTTIYTAQYPTKTSLSGLGVYFILSSYPQPVGNRYNTYGIYYYGVVKYANTAGFQNVRPVISVPRKYFVE